MRITPLIFCVTTSLVAVHCDLFGGSGRSKADHEDSGQGGEAPAVEIADVANDDGSDELGYEDEAADEFDGADYGDRIPLPHTAENFVVNIMQPMVVCTNTGGGALNKQNVAEDLGASIRVKIRPATLVLARGNTETTLPVIDSWSHGPDGQEIAPEGDTTVQLTETKLGETIYGYYVTLTTHSGSSETLRISMSYEDNFAAGDTIVVGSHDVLSYAGCSEAPFGALEAQDSVLFAAGGGVRTWTNDYSMDPMDVCGGGCLPPHFLLVRARVTLHGQTVWIDNPRHMAYRSGHHNEITWTALLLPAPIDGIYGLAVTHTFPGTDGYPLAVTVDAFGADWIADEVIAASLP